MAKFLVGVKRVWKVMTDSIRPVFGAHDTVAQIIAACVYLGIFGFIVVPGSWLIALSHPERVAVGCVLLAILFFGRAFVLEGEVDTWKQRNRGCSPLRTDPLVCQDVVLLEVAHGSFWLFFSGGTCSTLLTVSSKSNGLGGTTVDCRRACLARFLAGFGIS